MEKEDEFFADDDSLETIGGLIVAFLFALLMLGAIWHHFA